MIEVADPRDRLIVALDVDTYSEAMALVEHLGDTVTFYKVGLQLFLDHSRYDTLLELALRNKKTFLDLKVEDVPETVRQAIRNLESRGIHFFTLKGNGATTEAALQGRNDHDLPKFLQLTVLSSWDQSDLNNEFGVPEDQKISLEDFVVNKARKVLAKGCDGLIASGASIELLRSEFPDAIIVAPGVRPADTPTDDHKRSLTPCAAIKAGADHLVVGRPIRNANHPRHMAQAIIEEIESAL